MSAYMAEGMRILFRKERAGDHQVTAVLPDVEATYGRLVCYAHIGQHSECAPAWYYRTRKAAPSEYRDLLDELTLIYADKELRVVERLRGNDWAHGPAHRWTEPNHTEEAA